jgi:hypothetical protein
MAQGTAFRFEIFSLGKWMNDLWLSSTRAEPLRVSACLFEQLRISAPARGGLELVEKSKGKQKHSEDYCGK